MTHARIVVLLGTHNGASFLAEQIASIAGQTVPDIDIVLSDDGSTDGTLELAQKLAARWHKGSFEIVHGPQRGFSENYRKLLIDHSDGYDYVAFADQDDVWDADKLEIAIRVLRAHGARPALYCGRARYVDEAGEFLHLSPLFSKPPDFRNAITQSLAGANTMVLNRAAARSVVDASRQSSFVSHDWWAYIVVTAINGVVVYDPEPHIDYRQHASNVMGRNDTIRDRLNRISAMAAGQYRAWTDMNLAGLERFAASLPPSTIKTISDIRQLRTSGFASRLLLLRRIGLHRQTLLGNLGLVLAVTLGQF